MKTFEAGKNATQLGIDTKKKFVVVNNSGVSSGNNNGDILELTQDDGSQNPYFKNITNGMGRLCANWSCIAYLTPMQKGSVIVRNGIEKHIIARIEDLCAVGTKSGSVISFEGWYTADTLAQSGWTEKEAPGAVKEMTVAEVSALVGREVKIVESK